MNPSVPSGDSVRAPAGEVLLTVQHLTKYFSVGGLFNSKQLHALEDVSFSIRQGQVVALVGESGSGKSTIARLIARLMAPTSGAILLKGQDVIKSEPRTASLRYRTEVQMIFQDPFSSLNPARTIEHHLSRALLIHRKARGRQELKDRVHELLATAGLNPAVEFAAMYPHQLSGGQRQRVAIARALAVGPQIILADEPISMLDVSIRMGVLNLLESLKQERGISYLYITHDIASARYFADQTIVLYAGHLVEGAISEELMSHPAHPYTQLLLAAVPNPHADSGKRMIQARGEVPSRIDPPAGCPFAARCPQVMDICRQLMPGAERLGPGHWVRCHLYGPGAAEAVS